MELFLRDPLFLIFQIQFEIDPCDSVVLCDDEDEGGSFLPKNIEPPLWLKWCRACILPHQLCVRIVL
jgi:hypothetical protein